MSGVAFNGNVGELILAFVDIGGSSKFVWIPDDTKARVSLVIL